VIAIEQAGNLSRAAKVLHVSQPALSYALRKLENELGCASSRATPVVCGPTIAGRDVIAAAKRAVREPSPVELAAHTPRGSAGGCASASRPAVRVSDDACRAESARTHPAVRGAAHALRLGRRAAALRRARWTPRFCGCRPTPRMHVEVVHTEPRVVAVWRGHRLARRNRSRS